MLANTRVKYLDWHCEYLGTIPHALGLRIIISARIDGRNADRDVLESNERYEWPRKWVTCSTIIVPKAYLADTRLPECYELVYVQINIELTR